MSCAAELDICVPIGELYSEVIEWLDNDGNRIDLDGWSGSARIRVARPVSSTLIATIDVSISVDNLVTLSIPFATTATLTPGTYRWQLDLTEDAVPTNKVRAVEGKAVVEAGV